VTALHVPATQSGAGPSDAALVVAARAGEAWATEALFRRHARMVNGLAFRLIGRDADVDDLVQDSFAEALRSLHRLAEPQAFAKWLATIVVRTSHKLLRRRRLMRRLFLQPSPAIDIEMLVGSAVPPDKALELRNVYAALDAMPPDIRVPLVLRRVEGLPLDEVAEMCGTSIATVKRRVAEGEAELVRQTGKRGA
jgi:RNA polymerase sigma-70 factor (ECF subfamily)